MLESSPLYKAPVSETSKFDVGMNKADIVRETLYLDSIERVEFWDTFRPSVHIPFPSAATEYYLDDIAAVLANSKPATLLTPRNYNSPESRSIFNDEEKRFSKLAIKHTLDFHGGIMVILGKEDSVEKLLQLYQTEVTTPSQTAPDTFHIAVGKTLGYPQEAIDDFLKRVRSNRRKERFISLILGRGAIKMGLLLE